MNKKLPIIIALLFAGGAAYFYATNQNGKFPINNTVQNEANIVQTALAARFDYLSQNGNSSCSASFKESIPSLPAGEHLRGSCCSPMNLHRYIEQIEGLQKYSYISEIPPDPYDVEAGLAQNLLSYYDVELTPEEQKAYDYAMTNSNEKGALKSRLHHVKRDF
ncbi:MAG: hypothetical protein HYZ69_03750 [Candidatus Colwellbacteria bacterium]|nr:hypothetical protein [Candidatus Colwellbacteria bacterium]